MGTSWWRRGQSSDWCRTAITPRCPGAEHRAIRNLGVNGEVAGSGGRGAPERLDIRVLAPRSSWSALRYAVWVDGFARRRPRPSVSRGRTSLRQPPDCFASPPRASSGIAQSSLGLHIFPRSANLNQGVRSKATWRSHGRKGRRSLLRTGRDCGANVGGAARFRKVGWGWPGPQGHGRPQDENVP
jgi:hypothetical protein